MKPVDPGFIHSPGEHQAFRKCCTGRLSIAVCQRFKELRQPSRPEERSALHRVLKSIRYERRILTSFDKISDRALDRHRRKSVDVDDVHFVKPRYA